LIDRDDYWQCALIIPKGQGAVWRDEGIAAMRARIVATVPELSNLDTILTSTDQFHLLTVTLDRLDCWHRPGLLAIGDAAHAMSPIGGIGINLAIQDAVAAANILAAPMLRGEAVDRLLVEVEKRRLFPTWTIQTGQKLAQDNLIGTVLRRGAEIKTVPWPIRLLNRFPLLRRIPGRAIGMGIRREKVSSPAA
jgi:2-polyprenyl-6-methoxyphenol hydroxylase-like FAD-dependent oxidoreductase